MTDQEFWKELPAAVTVTDEKGIILDMNERAQTTFAREGGASLIGKNVLDCHPGSARLKLSELMNKQTSNHYTITKNGQKKIIHQLPWFKNGKFAGMVEISIPIPEQLSHFAR